MDNNTPIPGENAAGNQLMQDRDARFFLASVINSLQDSVVTINLDGIITSWNKGAEHLYGYPASEAIGQSLQIVLYPDDFKKLLETIDRIRAGETVDLFETVRLGKDGKHLHIEVILSPVKNDEGAIIGVSTVARDVTEFRSTREALQQSESRLRSVFEAAIDFGIVVMDREGIVTDWNRGAEKMFGYTKEEIIGQKAEIIFTGEDREAGVPQAEMENAATSGRSIDERWHLHKDGGRFFMSGVMTPLLGEGHQGFVKIARNITERKLVEEALFISEQRKSLAIKSAEMGEWEWNLGTDRIRISDEVATLVGLDPNEKDVSRTFLASLVPPEDQALVKDAIALAFGGLNILQVECRVRRPDNGDVKWVHIYGRVVAHETRAASRMIGVIYDITPRKRMEQQKDDFISLASHELKTPVTAIKSYCEYLLLHFEESEKVHELSLMRKMNNQVDRLTSLIRNLLDTSILTEGRIKLYIQPLNMNDLIEQHLESLKALAPEHNFTWKPGRAVPVNADHDRILQVIMNFISNAAKYSPANTDIIISTDDDQDKALLRVEDRGMGIREEAQPMIFDRYYRATNEPTQKGFGLGLYICAEIIRQHSGSIGVSSVPGKGSTFYFSLPYS